VHPTRPATGANQTRGSPSSPSSPRDRDLIAGARHASLGRQTGWIPWRYGYDAPKSDAEDARRRLLPGRDALFYAEGVNTVGIDRVIERAAWPRATLYSAFGSKEELIRAYLKARTRLTDSVWRTNWKGVSPQRKNA